MAGVIRLFEKDEDGLLHQVPPDVADARREGRMVAHVQMACYVLYTQEEEDQAKREAEEHAAMLEAQAERTAADKLDRLLAAADLTKEELKQLLTE